MPAAGAERIRGRLKAIGPTSTYASFFFDTIVVNRGVTEPTQRSFPVTTFQRQVRSAKTLRATLLRASYCPNTPKHTAQLWFLTQKLTTSQFTIATNPNRKAWSDIILSDTTIVLKLLLLYAGIAKAIQY